MAKVVRAEKDFEIDRQPDRLAVTYRSVHRGRALLAGIVIFGLTWVVVISAVVALISAFDDSRGAGEAFAASLSILMISSGLFFAFWKWGFKKVGTTVIVDAEGVITGNRKYLFADIDDIGWQFGSDGPTLISGRTEAAARDAARTISGIVYITYGNKTVTLIAGLSENETRRAFEVLQDAMNEMGASFGASEKIA